MLKITITPSPTCMQMQNRPERGLVSFRTTELPQGNLNPVATSVLPGYKNQQKPPLPRLYDGRNRGKNNNVLFPRDR